MNKRLKEFSDQAVEYAQATYIAYSDARLWNEIYRKKFAELILEDFIKVAGEQMGYSQYCAMRDNVTKHFGVEE